MCDSSHGQCCGLSFNSLSIEWNSIGGPAHGIVTKTVHKTLPGDDECLAL